MATALGTRPPLRFECSRSTKLPFPSQSAIPSIMRSIAHSNNGRISCSTWPKFAEQAQASKRHAPLIILPLTVGASPNAQSLYILQQTASLGPHRGFDWGAQLKLNWTLFDGGARKNNLAKAQANVRAAEARLNASRDQIADEVWRAYSNVKTALRQRQAATALLEAATQSYAAASGIVQLRRP